MSLRTVYLALLCLMMAPTYMLAQQWLDKKYDYDSLLNIPYGTAINYAGNLDTLRMDLYLPECTDPQQTAKRPALLWVHGGAWVTGSRKDASIQYMCREFAKRGYVTAAVSYRLGFVADDAAWSCNYPDYPCLFATDTAEWYRAYYRAVQDVKGAIRFLVNRNVLFKIDTDNLFVGGESAGAFTALGASLMDVPAERPAGTNSLSAVPAPHPNAANCPSIQGVTLPSSIPRPDLGSIDGTIEPSTTTYTIKGVGNIFGGMFTNLLSQSPAGKSLPAIYSYHQPCDIIVPIDSMPIFWGLTWCFTNGYNCFGIKNTPMAYGSRLFSNWNMSGNYGYTIQNDFTGPAFPYQFLIGAGSCLDQVNKPCHAYDNIGLRESNMAQFFAPLINTTMICDTGSVTGIFPADNTPPLLVYPNPATDKIMLTLSPDAATGDIVIIDMSGQKMQQATFDGGREYQISTATWPVGLYVALLISNGQLYKTSFVLSR